MIGKRFKQDEKQQCELFSDRNMYNVHHQNETWHGIIISNL